jgi:hypothetical protein
MSHAHYIIAVYQIYNKDKEVAERVLKKCKGLVVTNMVIRWLLHKLKLTADSIIYLKCL